jgi:hypothetical protein
MKLGDAVSSIATPIARAMHKPCIDPATNDLRPDSPCAKRKEWLNTLSDKMYDVLWPKTSNPEIPTMGKAYVINKQIAIDDADSPEDAVAKMVAGEGSVIGFNVVLRVQTGSSGFHMTVPSGIKTSATQQAVSK